MKRILPLIGLATMWLALATPVSAQTAPASCQFVLGFKTLHDMDTLDVGNCVDNQAFASNGDAQQHTTNGLMAWRKADNWTAFTNGYWTWINGPAGLVRRLNTDRFPWEADIGTVYRGPGWSVRLPSTWAQLPSADLPPGYVYYGGALPSPSIIAVVGFKAVPLQPGVTVDLLVQAVQQYGAVLGWRVANIAPVSVRNQDGRQFDVTFGKIYEHWVVWTENGRAWEGLISSAATSPDVQSAVSAYFMNTVLPTLSLG